MPNKVHYERVNLAEIESSSDDDDYGELFAKERRQALGKGRHLRNLAKKKGGKCISGSACWRALCVVFSVLAILGLLAGAALYFDPQGSLSSIYPGYNTTVRLTPEDTGNATVAVGTGDTGDTGGTVGTGGTVTTMQVQNLSAAANSDNKIATIINSEGKSDIDQTSTPTHAAKNDAMGSSKQTTKLITMKDDGQGYIRSSLASSSSAISPSVSYSTKLRKG